MAQEQAQEQREHYRIPCTGDGDLVVRVWPIPASDVVPKEPRAGAAATTTPVDICAGGLGLLITPEELRRLRLDRGSLIGALVERKDAKVILHGSIRRATTRADGLIRLGISVQLTEMSLERRRAVLKLEGLSATIRRIELELLARFGSSAPR